MFHENEDKVMNAPGICSDGSSCQHMFAHSLRVKKPGSRVKHLHWLHIQLLVVLLAGQASCNQTSAATSPLTLPTTNTTTTQTSDENNNNSNCSCSAYCNRTDAYYTFKMSTQDPQINFSYVSSLISKIKRLNCSHSANISCPLPIIASQYKDGNVACESTTTNLQRCRAILVFAIEVPICDVSAAVMNVFQSEKQITYNGEVVQAAICGNSEVTNNPLNFQLTWYNVRINPADFCTTVTQSNVLKCQNGKNVVVLLEEKCVHPTRPNVTTVQPNATTASVNVTSSPLNTTALNATTTATTVTARNTTNLNGTTTAANVTARNTTALNGTTTVATVTARNTTALNATTTATTVRARNTTALNGTTTAATVTARNTTALNGTTTAANVTARNTTALNGTTTAANVTARNTTALNGTTTAANVTARNTTALNGTTTVATVTARNTTALNGTTTVATVTARNTTALNGTTTVATVTARNTTALNGTTTVATVTARNTTALNGTTTAANVTARNTTALNATTTVANVTARNTTALNATTTVATVTARNTTALNGTTTIATVTARNTTALNATTTVATVTARNTTALNGTTTIATVTARNTTAPNATTTVATVTAHNTTANTTNVSVSGTTESADSQASALLDQTSDASKLNSSQVDQLVSQLENLLSGPTVSLALGNTSVHIVSNLLGASPETLSNSSERIIRIVDTVALKLVLEKEAETLLSPAVALSVKSADGNNFQETFFSISAPNNVEVRGDPRLRRSVTTDSSIPQGSIRLPPSLTQGLTSQEQQLASRVQFNFYQKSTVFQDRSLRERKLNSGILGASVANLSITRLQDDVVIHLRHTKPIPGNFVATCVFWDSALNDGSGGWNPDGCFVRNSTDNETVCGCNHLTSFAILLDLSRKPLTSRIQDTILTFITYIGCGISAIFLSITLLTYLTFGKLRKDIPSKILIQLCLALLMLNMVFLLDAWLALYPQAVGLCISTAWFLHYFLLVSFTWMGLEAVHMYLALVKVFNSYISCHMVKFSLVGWGVPMIVVIIVIAINKDNYGLVSYGKFADGTSDDFCWLKNDIAFYVAVVAYFCVIFLFNLVMFIVVLVQLCRMKRQNPHNAHHRTVLQDVRSGVGITILLGLTWGFAFFAWGPVNLPFMYLFAIFNSLQGFFIFVFHCAVKENVRKQWRTYLCCGRMKLAENSEWSRTATQKTVKKLSVTKLTSLHSSKSSQSNNSTSSSTFLVSDSSEQINGIGSPLEDRAITANEEPSMDVILNEINRQYRTQQAL